MRVEPALALREGFARIRREAGVPEDFPADVLAEAEAAARRAPDGLPVDLPFITIDPPGARDLDQALHLERREAGGHRVRYAIADVAAFVVPGGAIDRDAHTRGLTVYAPDEKAPLHPPVLSEGGASLLPGQWAPAVLWTMDLDRTGVLVHAHVERALVRSAAQHTYADVPDDVAELLAEVGERRLALERVRGGVRLNVPEQEVVRAPDGSWTVGYRAPLETEEHNAQVSLLTGIAAAELMLRARVGILRTQPPPDDKALARLRRQAAALGAPWPEGTAYPDFVRSLDPDVPAHAALMREAAAAGRGASYTAFDGTAPEDAQHFAIAAPYAHATAPLRRLQDRFVSECCLAVSRATSPPPWVRAGLAALPDAMAAGARRANAVERAVVDLVEAVVLAGREGERFDAVVVDDGLVQLRDPAVRGKVEGWPAPGTEVVVRLERADPDAREVAFSVA